MPARAIGSGTISFGLVSIPIKLYTAASSQSVSFNMLHAKCGGRMKQQYFCPVDNEVVERKDIVKGFEYARDQYVQFTDEELKKLDAAKTDALELVEFVPEKTVDFVYIEKTYYLGPDKGGDRAYQLLSEAMRRTQKIAVGRFWTRGKEQLVLVRPYKDGGLVLHYVYYADEVRAFDEVDRATKHTYKEMEVELADKLIAQLDQPEFKPDRFRDEYRDRVMGAVEQKVAGREVTVAPEEPKAQIIDLLEALKRSVAGARAGAANAAQSEEEEAAPATPRPPKKAAPRGKAGGQKKQAV
jgi:DNA end-binding protein Ku